MNVAVKKWNILTLLYSIGYFMPISTERAKAKIMRLMGGEKLSVSV